MKLPWFIQQIPAVPLVASLGGFLTVVHHADAQPWANADAPKEPWVGLAVSADGTRLVAAAAVAYSDFGGGFAGPIFISTNAGAAWIQTSAPSNNWSAVACSADGVRLVAVSAPFLHDISPHLFSDGLIYTSADMGVTWTPTGALSNTWTFVASSADGTNLFAVAAPLGRWDGTNWAYIGEGAIYRSPDAGVTWTRTSAPSNNWTGIASSADGNRIVAVAGIQYDGNLNGYVGDGPIYCSLDSGATWTRTSAPTNNWCSVASSADGRKWVAAASRRYDTFGTVLGLLYTSTNSGATWAATTAPANDWHDVASSADGIWLVAGTTEGTEIYISSDSGASWTRTATPNCVCSTAVGIAADGYRVFAASSGGWIGTLPYSGPWRLADAPGRTWTSVASSADGSKLVAVSCWDETIYTSSDSGTTWNSTHVPSSRWFSVASSADGVKLAAVADNDPTHNGKGWIYISTDSGAIWKPTSASKNRWMSVTSSADGATLVARASPYQGGDGSIWRSIDSGLSWTRTSAPSNFWGAVASSSDGTKLVAVASYNPLYGSDGLIYTSSDLGLSWTATSAPTNDWTAVTCSADGTQLVATALVDASGNFNSGRIYTSGDSGMTWKPTSTPAAMWLSIASSADGTNLVAAAETPAWIYLSTDSGTTWNRANTPAAIGWSHVASSADGSHIVAVSEDGYIFTLKPPAPTPPPPPSPRLFIEYSEPWLGLSWLVPSTRFVLQQRPALGSANWVDVPMAPTLDFTNLLHQVTMTRSSTSSFYRLKQRGEKP